MRRILIVMDSEIILPLPETDYELTQCRNARQAAELLSQPFDGLILDLFLPGTDGLTFLEDAKEHLPPVVLILTRLLTSYILQAVESLCGGYILRIPCSGREICLRLEDMFQKYESPACISVSAVHYHLHRLGLSPARKGFHCALYILPIFQQTSDPCLFKDFYPILAEQYAVTPATIDNALHREILRAYQNRKDSIWREYFPDTSCCPSNKEFLAAVAAKLQ